MQATRRFAAMTMLAWCVLLTAASAHGLLARMRTEGEAIVGTAYYSSGERAGGEWVEIFDTSRGDTKVAEFSAGADGTFRYEGEAGHTYRIAIHGDEGHFIELSMVVETGARAHLVEDQAKPFEAGVDDLPAWLVVGVILALVSLMAVFYRARDFLRVHKAGLNA